MKCPSSESLREAVSILEVAIATFQGTPMNAAGRAATGRITEVRKWLDEQAEAAEELEGVMSDIDRADLIERKRLEADHDASR